MRQDRCYDFIVSGLATSLSYPYLYINIFAFNLTSMRAKYYMKYANGWVMIIAKIYLGEFNRTGKTIFCLNIFSLILSKLNMFYFTASLQIHALLHSRSDVKFNKARVV